MKVAIIFARRIGLGYMDKRSNLLGSTQQSSRIVAKRPDRSKARSPFKKAVGGDGKDRSGVQPLST